LEATEDGVLGQPLAVALRRVDLEQGSRLGTLDSVCDPELWPRKSTSWAVTPKIAMADSANSS
jgi:hypothetical protein